MTRTILLSFFLLVFTTIHAQKNKQEIKIKTSAQCEMCKKKIEKAVKQVPGVGKATLNLKDKVITIKFDDSKTTSDAIKKAITTVGYDADETKANSEAYNKLPACCKKE